MKARIKGVARDVRSGEFLVTFSTASEHEWDMENDMEVTFKKWREKRSLDANAYYWSLVAKIAESVKSSRPEIHNKLLRLYGTLEEIGGKLVTLLLPDTEETEKKVEMKETYHLKPTSYLKEGKDGQMFRAYFLIKGSSEYDTKEMSTLIDGAISEAKELEIETIPPEEYERMMAAYEERYSKRR